MRLSSSPAEQIQGRQVNGALTSSAKLRALELGATLVTTVPGGTKVVLQMPRGNLEDIHPRSLVFDHLTPYFDR